MDNWNARTVLRRALIKAETLKKFFDVPKYKIKGDVSYRKDNTSLPRDFLGDFDTLEKLQLAHETSVEGDLAWVINEGLYEYEKPNGWTYQASAPYPLTDIALELQKIQTPEFHFTQSTLREVLQGVGSFIHGEPRVDENNEIDFDRYGSSETFTAPQRYASKSIQQSIDTYATNLDSTVDNLVSSFGNLGVISEPYEGGFKTVRTEDVAIRITDENMLIQTQYPIRSIRSLEVVYNSAESKDITDFVYEINDYNRLSSYEAIYPYTKAYALYYTTGNNNISGLFFKNSARASAFEAFNKIAIVNIINIVYGRDISSLGGDYYKLSFRVTYEPVYSARVQQNKSTVKELSEPSTIVYNQGQNLIESEYYGENLKGAIARLGNEDKTETFVFNGIKQVPDIGKLWEEDGKTDFYTSAVAVEIQPFYTKYSVALSKHFNRYSDYVNVNSTKRMFEVSEQQAYNSHIAYRDYVVIGSDKDNIPYSNYNDGLVTIDAIKEIFDIVDSDEVVPKVSNVSAITYTRDDTIIKTVQLPVQAVPMGNSAVFVFKYKDNYSAGDSAINTDGGVFTNYVQYSDYYGNAEFLQVDYIRTPPQLNTFESIYQEGMQLPASINITNQPSAKIRGQLWVSKGSTEIPTVDYQIDFVGYESDWIIGSGLAKNLPLVCGSKTETLRLVFSTEKLSILGKKINASSIVYAIQPRAYIFNNAIMFNSFIINFNFQGVKSWAVVDSGNNILFGKNEEISVDNASEVLSNVYMLIKHDIFN